MLESFIIIAFYMGALAIPFITAIGIYYLVIFIVYRKYKRNGGIYSFRKFIARRGLDL
jgi:hypothetical protein